MQVVGFYNFITYLLKLFLELIILIFLSSYET